ncbi:hypothetical protein LTR17_013184 [Elasticomyces elasticus]|nr:hypothetical protein LTR17_013184 [Elasticomyces elasticus]
MSQEPEPLTVPSPVNEGIDIGAQLLRSRRQPNTAQTDSHLEGLEEKAGSAMGEHSLSQIAENICQGLYLPVPLCEEINSSAVDWTLSLVTVPRDVLVDAQVIRRLWLQTCLTTNAVRIMQHIEACLAWVATGTKITAEHQGFVLAAAKTQWSKLSKSHADSEHCLALLRILELGLRMRIARAEFRDILHDLKAPTERSNIKIALALMNWLRARILRGRACTLLDCIETVANEAQHTIEEFGQNTARKIIYDNGLIVVNPAASLVTLFTEAEVTLQMEYETGSEILTFTETRRIGPALRITIDPFWVRQDTRGEEWVSSHMHDACRRRYEAWILQEQ